MARPRHQRFGRWQAGLAVFALLTGTGCAAAAPGVAIATNNGSCGSAPSATALAPLPAQLLAVSAVPGTRQAWALGRRFAGHEVIGFLVRFSGLNWASAVTFQPDIHLQGLSAVSGRSAWVWGYAQTGSSFTSLRPYVALVSGGVIRQEHAAFLSDVYLGVMASHGIADTFLVGGARNASGRQTGLVAARWDGTSWHKIPAPSAAGLVASFSTSGPSDAWLPTLPRGKVGLLHWNGTAWSMSYTPPAAVYRANTQPAGVVVASSAGHVEAVYNSVSNNDNGPGRLSEPFLAYFDGSAWQTFRGPSGFSDFTDITMSGQDTWAIGQPRGRTGGTILYSRVPGRWCVQQLPIRHPRGCDPWPSAISAASPTYVVAVSNSTGVGCQFAYVFNGRNWRSVNPRA
jgi:hypothetical protein